MVPMVAAETLNDYPDFYKVRVGIVVGDLAIASDTIGAIEIATSLKEFDQKLDVIPMLASEVEDLGSMDLIVIGGPCANGIAARLMDFPDVCYESVQPNTGLIQLYEMNGHEIILVAGSSAKDTRTAARSLVNDNLPTSSKLVVRQTSQTEITLS